MAKRRVGFYILHTTGGADTFRLLRDTLNYIQGTPRPDRIYQLDSKKKMVLGSKTVYDTVEDYQFMRILFKSGKTHYRPPLLDFNRNTERDNPKNLPEADRNLTHIIGLKDGNDIRLYFEKSQDGVTASQVVLYLNRFIQQAKNEGEEFANSYFKFDIIATDRLDELVEEMDRLKVLELYTDKEVLGSPFYNFNNEELRHIKGNAVLKITAELQKDITPAFKAAYQQLIGNSISVKAIRIKGDKNNSEVSYFSEKLERKEYVTITIDDSTGEIVSESIYEQLERLADQDRN
jgi:hypothetical protein